jgi:molybdate transport system ATP-binding protein
LAYLQTLQDKHPIPIIYVTHSTEEVLALASHLILLNQGRVTEHGTIAQIFPRLSQETKLTNQIFIQGITTQYNAQYQTYQITSGEDKLDFPAPAHHPIALNSSITLMIDARHIILSKTSLQDSTGANSLMGSITDLKAFTCNHLHTVTINTISNSVEIPVHNHVMQCLELQIGDQVYLNINPLNLHPIRDKS